MRRRLWISAAFAVGLFAVAAQPPAKLDPPADKKKKADPADAAVAAALAHDPDVQVARAKVQLAEAELAKAKQGVVIKVMTLNAAIQEAKRAVAAQRDRTAWAERMAQQGVGDQRQLADERGKLESTQAALAKAEMELKLITGGGAEAKVLKVFSDTDLVTPADADSARRSALIQAMAAAHAAQVNAPVGPIPDRIRAALDKPVKLGAEGEKVTLAKAMEVFKREAGLDVPLRTSANADNVPNLIEILVKGEEMSVGAWLQLFEDNAFIPVRGPDGVENAKGRLYVRDYGILIALKGTVPPDAPTLTEFWKQKPVPEKKPEPAPGPEKK